jgi:uncharacterized protein YneF (UPF0154 family)
MSILDIVAIVAAFVVTGWFLKIALSPRRDEPRYAEDDARAFFERHGHWPDEDPAEARARAERGAAAERAARAAREAARRR